MGEMNMDLAAGKPKLIVKPFPFTDAADPVVAVGRFRGGEAVLVNLAPGPCNTYCLIVAPVTMLDVEGEDKMDGAVRGWLRPALPVADFLAAYSHAGGTHHSALVYGDLTDEIGGFGEIMGWNVSILG
jgi:L-arabinose isomerase